MTKKRIPWNKGLKTNKPANNRVNINKDDLYDLYVNQKLTSKEIGEIYNCSSKCVRNWLTRYNIPIRSMADSVKLERSKWTDEKELERSKKYHQTWKEKPQNEKDAAVAKRYSSPNMNSPESIKKAHTTRILNGTSKESKAEEDFYKWLILEGFDETDIIRHYYQDSRYPFNCDFYIPSKDLFIEYQGHWSHGTEPYTGSREQLDSLELYKTANVDMTTWINRDVNKRETALRNNINLVLVYPKNKTYLISNGTITTIDINDISKI